MRALALARLIASQLFQTSAADPPTFSVVPLLLGIIKIGWWNTEAIEPDSALYTLRLEVFDENGVKLTSAVVDSRDGSTPPPGCSA